MDKTEEYAFAVLRALTGAQVEHADVKNAPPRTVDGVLHFPDGRTGVVEVTRLAETDSMHLERLMEKTGRKLPAPGEWSWSVEIDELSEWRPLLQNYEEVVAALEAHGVYAMDDLPEELVETSDALRWALETPVQFDPLRPASGMPHRNPAVISLRSSAVAVWDAHSDPIGESIRHALSSSHVQRKLEKLLEAQSDERHLFLIVDRGGLTEAAQFELYEPEEIPSTDPLAPSGISHIWVTNGWGSTILVWQKIVGWKQRLLPSATP